MAGGWASGQRSSPPNWYKRVFHSHHAAVLRTVLTYSDTFLGGEQFTVKHSRWDHFEQVTSPRLPVTAALIDAAIGVKAPFYRNIQFVNFSQLERISLLNCWERGELSLTLDQVLRLIAAVIECFNCSRLHLNCDPCTTHTHTGVSAHFQPAPTLSFYRLFFSLFVVLATFISTAYHGQATGAKVLYSKNPAGLFYWYSRGELLWWSRYDNAMQNAPEAFCVTAPCWRSIQAEVSLSIIFEYLDHNIQRLVLENIAILGDKKHGELSLCRYMVDIL